MVYPVDLGDPISLLSFSPNVGLFLKVLLESQDDLIWRKELISANYLNTGEQFPL